MSTKNYILTLAILISCCYFSACTSLFRLDMDAITRQNRAKVIRLFAYDNFTAALQDTTLLTSGQRQIGAPIIKYIFKDYKCIGDDPIVEESYINTLVTTYEVNGVRMRDHLPTHFMLLSCKGGKKFEIRFNVEGDRWLIDNIDEHPRPRYLD